MAAREIDIAITPSTEEGRRRTLGSSYGGNGKHLPEADSAVIVRADIGQDSIRVYVSKQERRASSAAIKDEDIKKAFRVLANKLCMNHPLVSTGAEVLGGAPHIKGTRLSVRTILAKLYVYGSIQAIVKIYEPHLSEEQVKEALAYAQDFMEIASGLHEVS